MSYMNTFSTKLVGGILWGNEMLLLGKRASDRAFFLACGILLAAIGTILWKATHAAGSQSRRSKIEMHASHVKKTLQGDPQQYERHQY